MEEVIRKIIEIEKSAQDRLKNAEEEKVAKEKELKEVVDHLEKKIIHDAQNKVVQLREMEIELANKEASSLNEQCIKKLDAIDAYYKELADMWCSKLYNSVIKR